MPSSSLAISGDLRADDLEVIASALQHWDDNITVRYGIQLTVDYNAVIYEDGHSVGGHAVCSSPAVVDLYMRVVGREREWLYNGFLHELTHVHLGCNDDDHVDDTGSLMNPVVRFYRGEGLDCDTLSRLAVAVGDEQVPGLERCE